MRLNNRRLELVPEIYASLMDGYREDISRLEDLLKRDLPIWQ